MTSTRTIRPLRSIRSLAMILFSVLLLSSVQFGGASAQVGDRNMAGNYLGALNGGPTFWMLTATSQLHTPEGDFVGVDSPHQFDAVLGDSFSDVAFTTQSVETQDNLVIIWFTFTGINTGSYHGLAPDCAGVAVPGVAVLQLAEAGIAQQWVGYDGDSLASQIAAFNDLDPNTRPGCADYLRSQPVAMPEANPETAPQCMAATECRTAF